MSTESGRHLRARRWRFVFNNPQDKEYTPESFLKKLSDYHKTKRLVFQLESGDAEGTPHYQGYIELTDAVSRFRLSKCIGYEFDLRTCDGTAQSNYTYCTKESTRLSGPYEYGDWTVTQGDRNDIQRFKDDVVSGMPSMELCQQHTKFFMNCPKGAEKIIDLLRPKRTLSPRVFLFFGLPGCGKSYLARRVPGTKYVKEPGHSWFLKYDGESVLIMDDFAGGKSKMGLMQLLRLLDRYAYTGEKKGGHCDIAATTIVLTSNYHPLQWYKWEKYKEQWHALSRRITNVICWTKTNNPDTGLPTPFVADKAKFFPELVLKSRPVPHMWQHGPPPIPTICPESYIIEPVSPHLYSSDEDNVHSLFFEDRHSQVEIPILVKPAKRNPRLVFSKELHGSPSSIEARLLPYPPSRLATTSQSYLDAASFPGSPAGSPHEDSPEAEKDDIPPPSLDSVFKPSLKSTSAIRSLIGSPRSPPFLQRSPQSPRLRSPGLYDRSLAPSFT